MAAPAAGSGPRTPRSAFGNASRGVIPTEEGAPPRLIAAAAYALGGHSRNASGPRYLQGLNLQPNVRAAASVLWYMNAATILAAFKGPPHGGVSGDVSLRICKPFAVRSLERLSQPSDIPPRLGEIRDKPCAHWSPAAARTIGIYVVRLLRSKRRDRPPTQ